MPRCAGCEIAREMCANFTQEVVNELPSKRLVETDTLSSLHLSIPYRRVPVENFHLVIRSCIPLTNDFLPCIPHLSRQKRSAKILETDAPHV